MNLFDLVKSGTTLLGQNPTRFFEFGFAPQLEKLPYATWQELRVTPFNYLAGAPSTDTIKTQIDVWATTAQECRTVARAVRRAIDSACTVSFLQNSWDEDSRLYRTTLHATYSQEI
jgi:hypothetical protein